MTLIGGDISDFFARSGPVVILGSAASTGAVGSFTMATQLARLPETIIVGPIYMSVFTSAARALSGSMRLAANPSRALNQS